MLNHEPKVRESTQERVQRAMELLNYSPNTSARRLAGKRSYLLGLLYDNPGNNYITNIQLGALAACREDHYDILIYPCNYKDAKLPEQIRNMFRNVRVDGLLLTPPICDVEAVSQVLRQIDAPNVVISQGASNGSRWSVGTNDQEICAKMVHHLAELGHRRIAFVRGDPDHHAIEKRFEGFLEGMQQCGIETFPEYHLKGSNVFASGIACGRQLLELGTPPTAVFCANDDMAAGVMNVAHEKGLSIPADLSVAGFDDTPLASQTWPPLTTVRQPINDMASLATRFLISRIRGQLPDGASQVLDSELIYRDSTGPVPMNWSKRPYFAFSSRR